MRRALAPDVRSAAVPRLSAAEGAICTTARESPCGGDQAGLFDRFALTAIDAEAGSVIAEHHLGAGFFSGALEMVGVLTPDRVLYRGTVSGLARLEPPAGAEHAWPVRPRTGSAGTTRSSGQENPP